MDTFTQARTAFDRHVAGFRDAGGSLSFALEAKFNHTGEVCEITEKIIAGEARFSPRDKLIFRHPHVYGDAVAKTAGDVVMAWEQIKQKEKDGNKTVLGGVPASLPSVIKAYRIQDKARAVGFDWDNKEDVWGKVREELGELQAELMQEDNIEKQTREYGDFLFSLINAARLYHINPDNALEHTNQKFIRRFNYVEQKAKEQGLQLKEMTLAQMDALWNEAKQGE